MGRCISTPATLVGPITLCIDEFCLRPLRDKIAGHIAGSFNPAIQGVALCHSGGC